jgi:hypothetical protein
MLGLNSRGPESPKHDGEGNRARINVKVFRRKQEKLM